MARTALQLDGELASFASLSRLPPGRHGLPREFVAKNQRDRLTAGTIAAVAEHGYHDTTVARIVAAAGVSRRTFYEHYSSREECFLAAYELIEAHLIEAMAAAAADFDDEWPKRVRAMLATLLSLFAANPDLVRFCLAAPQRAGEEPIAARLRLFAARILAQLLAAMPSGVPQPPPAVRDASLGGIVALVLAEVEQGGGQRLPELLPELTELFLAPYLGREKARNLACEESRPSWPRPLQRPAARSLSPFR